MFTKSFIILIFAFSFLGASDIEKKSFKNNGFIKKSVACGVAVLSTIVSEKFIFLLRIDREGIDKKENVFKLSDPQLSGPLFNLLIGDKNSLEYSNSKLSYLFMLAWLNVKLIIHENDHLPLATKQNACSFISILHGAFFGWCSYKVLNKFFPSQ